VSEEIPALDIAAYQARVYEEPRCWRLVTDVYADLIGASPAEVETVSESMRRAARAFRLELFKRQPGMRQLQEPQDLAVVLMWPSSKERRAHCGIYWAGSVLHATEAGVLYQDLASLRSAYPLMEFWAR
jgi:hypothetical protein